MEGRLDVIASGQLPRGVTDIFQGGGNESDVCAGVREQVNERRLLLWAGDQLAVNAARTQSVPRRLDTLDPVPSQPRTVEERRPARRARVAARARVTRAHVIGEVGARAERAVAVLAPEVDRRRRGGVLAARLARVHVLLQTGAVVELFSAVGAQLAHAVVHVHVRAVVCAVQKRFVAHGASVPEFARVLRRHVVAQCLPALECLAAVAAARAPEQLLPVLDADVRAQLVCVAAALSALATHVTLAV